MPWDPMRDLVTMQERLESLFGRAAPGWVPPVDLAEQPDAYVLMVELPGLKRDNIHIDATAQSLTVRGHRPPTGTGPRVRRGGVGKVPDDVPPGPAGAVAHGVDEKSGPLC